MENQNLVLALVFVVAAVSLIKAMFGKKEKPVEVDIEQVAKCGCGRSKSGLCEGLHNLTDKEWAEKNKPAKAPRKPKTPVAKKAAVTKIKKEIASIPAEKPAKKTKAKKTKAEVNG